MNIKDLQGDIEVESPAPTESAAPLNLKDLGSDYEVEAAPESPSDPILEGAKGLGGGLVGGATGAGIGLGLNKAADFGLGIAGELTKEQTDFISQDPKRYTDSRYLEELKDQWRNLGQDVSETSRGAADHYNNNLRKVTKDVNEASYKLAEQAKASLKTEAPMPKNTFYEGIGEGLLKSDGALSPITPEVKKEFFNQNFEIPFATEKENLKLQEVNKRVDYLKANAAEMENFKGTDVYSKFQNDLKVAEKNLADEVNKIKERVAKDAVGKYKASTGIPEELRNAVPGLEDKMLDNKTYKKMVDNAVGMANNPMKTLDAETVGAKFGLVPTLREGVDFDKAGASTVNDFAENLSESVRGKAGELYPTYDENMKASSRAIGAKESLDASGVKIGEDGIESLTNPSATKIRKVLANPELFPDEYKQLQRAIDSTREFSQSQPLDFVQERLSQADRIQGEMKEMGLKFNPKTDAVDLKGDVDKKLVNLANMPQDNRDVEKLQKLIDEARTIGSDPSMKSGKDFLEEVKASDIKNTVKEAGTFKSIDKKRAVKGLTKATILGGLGYKEGGVGGGLVGAGIGTAAELYGTKLQELASIYGSTPVKDLDTFDPKTKTGKVLNAVTPDIVRNAKLGKVAKSIMPGFLGVGGAMLGASAAAQAGELTPGEAAVAGTFEAINPIPLTDIVQGTVDAKKAYKDTGSVVDAGIAGAKGFVSPVPAVAELAKEGIDYLGTQKSNQARSGMDERYQKLDSFLKKSDNNEVLQSGKNLRQATPEQLMELTQSFKEIKGADNFVAPLENAAQAKTDEERQARLFGLYQQPAFRQLLKKKQEEEEETGTWNIKPM
jgi:hypothetical protein